MEGGSGGWREEDEGESDVTELNVREWNDGVRVINEWRGDKNEARERMVSIHRLLCNAVNVSAILNKTLHKREISNAACCMKKDREVMMDRG